MGRRSYISRGRDAASRPGFDLDGVEFLAQPTCFFDMREWFRGLAELDKVDVESAEGIDAFASLFTAMFGEAGFEKFHQHCRSHWTPANVIMAAAKGLLGDLMGVPATTDPTLPLPDSSDGPASSGATSTVGLPLGADLDTLLNAEGIDLTSEQKAQIRGVWKASFG